MRYPDGGAMSMSARGRRQAVREQAAELFAPGRPTAVIASGLRVAEKSVRKWRRRWTPGGVAAVASAGAGGATWKPSADHLARPRTVLDDGPVAPGWTDQRWTLARLAE